MANKPLDYEALESMTLNDLYELAKERSIKNYRKLKKHDIIEEILDFEKAMHRHVEITIASVPKDLSSPLKPVTPLAFGDPDTEEDEEEIEEKYEKKLERPDTEYKDEPKQEGIRSTGFGRDFAASDQRAFRESAPPIRPAKEVPAKPEIKRDEVRRPTVRPRYEPQAQNSARTFDRTERGMESTFKPQEAREPETYQEQIQAPREERIEIKPRPTQDYVRRGVAVPPSVPVEGELQKGVLDIHPEGTYGFVRQKEFKLGEEDIYVSISQIKKFALKTGDVVAGTVRPPRDQERYKSLIKIERINELPPDQYVVPRPFEKLVPVYPDQRLYLESEQYEISTRLLDLFSPIGRGQRCIIVAKPKAGKTVMLKKIAAAIANNHPDIELIALLIDERPEEVTDFERNIDGLVISSTFDEKPENHIQTAELTIEYAKRRVEQGFDVMILLDSLTRLARSYNLTCPPSGKTLSGGLDPNSLYKPKRFLGAARNIEGGGSLTIISTALIETGSRLDDIIYEEFKGTANSEVHLIRELADKRIFPAVDLLKSGTRHEELLYNAEEMECLWQLRKMISEMDEAERMSRLINKLLKTKSNVELLLQVQKAVDSGH